MRAMFINIHDFHHQKLCLEFSLPQKPTEPSGAKVKSVTFTWLWQQCVHFHPPAPCGHANSLIYKSSYSMLRIYHDTHLYLTEVNFHHAVTTNCLSQCIWWTPDIHITAVVETYVFLVNCPVRTMPFPLQSNPPGMRACMHMICELLDNVTLCCWKTGPIFPLHEATSFWWKG